MTEALLLILALGLVGGGLYAFRLLAQVNRERLADKAANEDEWRKVTLALISDQRDAANRLLIRNGVMPSPKEDAPRVPPSEIDHDKPDDVWAAEDERNEIEDKAREAMANPLKAELLEDAAKYDPMWAAVLDRYREMKRQVS